jgi:transcriptional regulator of arginine metabolism
LLELLEGGLAATQEEIRGRLAREGFRVTQATVSRDLEDVGAVRLRRGEAWVYALPERNGPPTGFGRRVFSELVIDCVPSGTLVVVRTFPGMAPTVGAVLDQSEIPGVVGTVAGDDTVLVVAAEDVGGKALAARILGMAEQRGAS